MNVKVRVKIGQAWVEVDAATCKDAVKAIAPYYDVFGEVSCGLCKSPDIGVHHRMADGHDYYGVRCFACGGQLDLGQHKEGGALFPKRKDADGNWDNEHGGWYRWQDRKKSESPSSGEPQW